jgi:hypothetical protein
MPLLKNYFLLKNGKKGKSQDFKIHFEKKSRLEFFFAFKISSQKNTCQKR